MKRDHRHLHKTAYEAIAKDEIDDFEGLRVALQTLAPTSDFIKSLFEADGVTLKKIEPPAEKVEGKDDEPDLTAVETVEAAAAKFSPTTTKKRRAMALLMAGRWSTIEIRDALQASEALISQARRELKQMQEAGLIEELPRGVTHAMSEAKHGVLRPDQTGDLHPSAKNKGQAGWSNAKPHRHSDKKK